MSKEQNKKILLVSACLVGLTTRYDAQAKQNCLCLKAIKEKHWVPFCPEQLGGLATPRPAARIVGGDGNDVLNGDAEVITKNNEIVTKNFIQGAQQVLELAELVKADCLLLKSKSPSCGVSQILGVTAALMIKNGYSVKEF